MIKSDKLRKMSENDRSRPKPDPGQNLSGKIFASRNSPEHVVHDMYFLKKPDSSPKIRIPASGKNPEHKNLCF